MREKKVIDEIKKQTFAVEICITRRKVYVQTQYGPTLYDRHSWAAGIRLRRRGVEKKVLAPVCAQWDVEKKTSVVKRRSPLDLEAFVDWSRFNVIVYEKRYSQVLISVVEKIWNKVLAFVYRFVLLPNRVF